MKSSKNITVEVPLTQEQSPKYLYHYVPSIDVLQSIFYETKEFWFKSVSESNDPCERYFRLHPTPIYQACFTDSCCEEKLWEEYKCGVCIQIKPCLSIFSINNKIDLADNFIYESSDRVLVQKFGLELGKLHNRIRPHEFLEDGEVLGPFPKNYIKEYENIKFSDPFLKTLYKTSSTWSYQNEWRYLINKIDTYFEKQFPGSYEWKETEIPNQFKVKLNEQFFKHSKVLFHPKYCSMSELVNFSNVEDYQMADIHQDRNLTQLSEFVNTHGDTF
jgi:hypothetical protein